jgi:hypothetical protein
VRPGLWAGKSLHPYRSVEAEPTGALSGEYVRGPEGALQRLSARSLLLRRFQTHPTLIYGVCRGSRIGLSRRPERPTHLTRSLCG